MTPVAVRCPTDAALALNEVERRDFTRGLPAELLVEIFSMVKDDSEGTEWQTVTWVDRRWRAIALCGSKLWKTVFFDHRLAPADALELVQRSGSARGLDLTFDARLAPCHAREMLKLTQKHGACARMRKLAVWTASGGFSVLRDFLMSLQAPHLESLTLVDETKERSCHGVMEVPFEENDSVFMVLADLPQLKELRMRGFLLLVPPTTLARLSILETSDTDKYNLVNLGPESMDEYLQSLLTSCPNLEQLVLHGFHAGSYLDWEKVTLPGLQYLEILHERPYQAPLYNHLKIPKTAAVHLYTPLKDAKQNVLLYQDNSLPPLFENTASLAFNANTNQHVCGWRTAHPTGSPAWCIMGEMSRLDARTRSELLLRALRDLPRTVNFPMPIVHLELHIHFTMPDYLFAAVWRELLLSLPALRVLRGGGERAARSFLCVLAPHARCGPSERAQRCSVLLPRLRELGLCLVALRAPMCVCIAERVRFVSVLRIWLSAEAHEDKVTRRETRRNRRSLTAEMERRWGTKVRAEYRERCETCHHAADRAGVFGHNDDSGFDLAIPNHRLGDGDEDGGWQPADDPDEWSSTSGAYTEDSEQVASSAGEDSDNDWSDGSSDDLTSSVSHREVKTPEMTTAGEVYQYESESDSGDESDDEREDSEDSEDDTDDDWSSKSS
ncbi:uncharacterized protein TRAVEDRAFT_49966 [Trametes versicolor FP-101664 SS1]|uniref:uncharacterized protein n=1 Tax=Trametes versicolor (strain FP-101664) TaxID=717944 RepID=UPI00046227C5|nr:uncharacterized protein TRAVEDRAFT_49966 [Trametes versicolor FP-101664 SS1]EIW55476.1 hypothetical protein TRAVEDRAFT_49966 [Trametes versicolor FP-101664 SS1]